MIRFVALGRSRFAAAAAAVSAVLTLGVALPAQAGSLGWRQVFTRHYGVATDYSMFGAVVATANNNAWALGGSQQIGEDAPAGIPIAEHWNGKVWSRYSMPKGVTDAIVAASAPAANDIWAVTHLGGCILHWDGHRWSLVKRLPASGPLGAQLSGVLAFSAKNVWVFGGSGFTVGYGTWHYNGKSWTRWGGNAVDIGGASAVSAANIWATGGLTSPQSAIVHYTGSWTMVSAPALASLEFGVIKAFSAMNVWVSANPVGKPSRPLLVHYNGHTWTSFTLPWNVTLSGGIASDGQGGLWMSAFAGSQRYEVHRTAQGAWSRTAVGAWLRLAHVPGTRSLLGVGSVIHRTGGNAVIWAYGTI
jgi:hypothetical protein